MLPVRLMTLFTWSEFELMTCGTPEVDIDNLRRHTRYGVSVNPKEDKHIGIMWQVLEGRVAMMLRTGFGAVDGPWQSRASMARQSSWSTGVGPRCASFSLLSGGCS